MIPPRHFLLELHGCPAERLDDPTRICRCIEEAAVIAGTTVLQVASHHFEPHGVTAIALLAESHLSIHCWPETGYAAVDLLTCTDAGDPQAACQHIVKTLAAKSHHCQIIQRGDTQTKQVEDRH